MEHFLLRSNVNIPLNLFSKHVRYPQSLQNTKLASHDILRNEQFGCAPLNRQKQTDMRLYQPKTDYSMGVIMIATIGGARSERKPESFKKTENF